MTQETLKQLANEMIDTLPFNTPEYWIGRIKEALAQEQEPVGYWKEHAQGMQRDYDLLLADYEKLAQRTWVGLTDVEIDYLLGSTVGENEETHISFARAIEAKLKELNDHSI